MATAPIEALKSEVFKKFPKAHSGGDIACRRIENDPKRDWSQHAWGNALDIMVPDAATGTAIYAWILANKTRLGIRSICWQAFGGCNPASHQDHLHVEGLPKMSGTPPCAGGSQPAPPEDDRRTWFQKLVGIEALPSVLDLAEEGQTVGTGLPLTEALGADIGDMLTRGLWLVAGGALTVFGLVSFMKILGVQMPTLPGPAGLVQKAVT